MRRFINIMLFTLFIFFGVGCGSGESEDNSDQGKKQNTQKTDKPGDGDKSKAAEQAKADFEKFFKAVTDGNAAEIQKRCGKAKWDEIQTGAAAIPGFSVANVLKTLFPMKYEVTESTVEGNNAKLRLKDAESGKDWGNVRLKLEEGLWKFDRVNMN